MIPYASEHPADRTTPPLRHFSTAEPSRFATTPHSALSRFAQPFPSLFASCRPNRETGARFGPATPTTSHLPQVLSPCSPRRHVCITKYNCGKDAVDSEKIHAIATASPPSELQSSLLPATDLLDPAAFNPSIAEYYTNHALALDHLTNKCIDYDMTGSVFMPESFCFETREYGGPYTTLSVRVTFTLSTMS
jgi:hypothetical protein